MMKLFKREIILWFIFLPFWSACILLTITARVNFDLNGFAVADGKLYVGLSNSVEIIENGRCVTKIPVSEFADGTSYVFALEDNQIAIYRPLNKEIREISGDVLVTEEYTDTAVFNAKFKKKTVYQDVNGIIYQQKKILGYYTIQNLQTGETVYTMPRFDYGVYVLWKFLAVFFVCFILHVIFKQKKLKKGGLE